MVSTHSRPKAAGAAKDRLKGVYVVSTHSRPKAAGSTRQIIEPAIQCFNTQPPEGGWVCCFIRCSCKCSFNTQPPEGGWVCPTSPVSDGYRFQHTAARRRLAEVRPYYERLVSVSTHSRPKAAGHWGTHVLQLPTVSTHSRPKAAGC